MTNKGVSKYALYAIDRLVDFSPVVAPKVLQRIILTIVGSRFVYSLYRRIYGMMLRRVSAFDKILVLGDIGIGDAINVQQAVDILRSLFPHAQIDYLCHETGGDLLSALPSADHVFRVFEGYGVSSKNDQLRIQSLLRQQNYDVILNFSPFVETGKLGKRLNLVNLYVPMAAYVLRSWNVNGGPRHVSSMLRTFLLDFFSEAAPALLHREGEEGLKEPPSFKGNVVYLPHYAVESAQEFLKKNNLAGKDRLVFFNPDGTCRFSQIPIPLQQGILKVLLESRDIGGVLIGFGHTDAGIGERIAASMPEALRNKLCLVPPLPLPVYAALTDACDVFISGDGGPVHIAAAKKVPLAKDDLLRNRTAVVSIFGATDSRMYGYDSERPDHSPSYQDAPSKVFVGSAPCRSLMCVNKLGKTCNEVRCFHGLEAETIAGYVKSYCRSRRMPAHKIPRKPVIVSR
jgi:heptosyltransferase-2/heptosyltransferase-3